jgi:hypothetical protein
MALSDLKKKLKTKIRLATIKAAREVAAVLPELIRLRTRQAGEGPDGALKGLADNTKKYRDRYKDNLHPDTTPDTSNLTATGQLLDSIQGRNVAERVIVEPKGKRFGELSGGRSKKTNKQVAKAVEDNGRVFLEMSEEEKKSVEDLATQIIKDEINSVIK